MRVKIIANKPIDDGCSDISIYIGQEFNAEKTKGGSVYVDFGSDNLEVYPGEYEVVE